MSDSSAADWARLISGEMLESEVRLEAQLLAESIARPATFSAKGFSAARQSLATLSVLFAVIDEYPESLRWKPHAKLLAGSCLAAANQCQEGGPDTLALASRISEALDGLLSGGRPELADSATTHGQAPPRPARADLMARLERTETALSDWTADPRQLQRHREEALQEADMVTVLGRWIGQPEYEFADDGSYQALARSLEEGGQKLRGAISAGDGKVAGEAWTAIGKSCADCHSGFRT